MYALQNTPRIVAGLALAIGLTLPGALNAQEPAAPAAAPVSRIADLPLTAEQRQVYVGSYNVVTPEGQMIFRVFEENGLLKGEPQGEEAIRIYNQGAHVFNPQGMPDFTITFAVVDGRATKLTARRGDMVLEGTRQP